jgi:hypothetical protein
MQLQCLALRKAILELRIKQMTDWTFTKRLLTLSDIIKNNSANFIHLLNEWKPTTPAANWLYTYRNKIRWTP